MHSDGLWACFDFLWQISFLHSMHLIICNGQIDSKWHLRSFLVNFPFGGVSQLLGQEYSGILRAHSPLFRWLINSSYPYTFFNFLSFCFRVTFFSGLHSWLKFIFFRIQFSMFLFTLFLPQYSWYLGHISDLAPTLDFWISSRQDRQNIFSHLSHSCGSTGISLHFSHSISGTFASAI